MNVKEDYEIFVDASKYMRNAEPFVKEVERLKTDSNKVQLILCYENRSKLSYEALNLLCNSCLTVHVLQETDSCNCDLSLFTASSVLYARMLDLNQNDTIDHNYIAFIDGYSCYSLLNQFTDIMPLQVVNCNTDIKEFIDSILVTDTESIETNDVTEEAATTLGTNLPDEKNS